MSSFFSRRSFFALTAVVFLLLMGCQQQPKIANNSVFVSQQGVKVEAIFPEHVGILLSFGTEDVGQQEKLAKLAQLFPEDGFANLMNVFAQDFNNEFAAAEISLEKDVMPLMGEHPRMMVAFPNSVGVAGSDVVGAVAITDEAATDLVLKKLTKEGYETAAQAGTTIYTKNGFSLVRYQDVVLIASRPRLIQEGLLRLEKGEPGLLNNESYQKGIAKVSGSLGFVFSDTQYFLGSMAQQGSESQQDETQSEASQQIPTSKLLTALDGEIYALYAEDHGLRIKGNAYTDEERLQEVGASFSELNLHEAYLYKQIPGDGMAYYVELYNPRKAFEMSWGTYENMENFKQMFAQARTFFTLQGVDVEKDVLTFLDRGMAFSLRKVGGLIPEVGIYIDASSHPEGARKVMEKLHGTLEALFLQASATPEAAPLLKLFTHEKTGDGTYRWSVDFNKLADKDKQQIPAFLVSTLPEFTFGVDAKNVAFMRLGVAGEGSESVKTFADNEDLKQAQSFIDGFDKGFFYVNPQEFMGYFDDLVAFAQSVGTSNTAEQMKEYEDFKQYILPVKSIIFSSGQPSGTETAVQAFVYIGE
jgi:hypothetical protein